MSHMAVGFPNAIRTDASFGVFIINTTESYFFPSFCSVSSNAFWVRLVHLATAMQPLLGDVCLFFFKKKKLARRLMLAKRGTVFVRGCIGYHFDGLLSQLLVALHPLVLFIATFIGYDRVGGYNRVYCVCSVQWPFNLFFPVLFLFDWAEVLWPQFSKVLKTCAALGPPRP